MQSKEYDYNEYWEKVYTIADRVKFDIDTIVINCGDEIREVYYQNNSYLEMMKYTFNIFFYEYVFTYEREEIVKDGMIEAIKDYAEALKYESNDISDVFDFEEYAINKINLYMDNFKFPEYDDSYAGKSLFEEIINLDDENIYKKKLWYALLYPLYEGEELDSFNRQLMINAVLVDYDFDYKLPQEIKYIREENNRIDNHIPKFDNVEVGDTWEGGRREANFVRALGLKPHKAKSNWRIAQMKSIRRSCRWEDDGRKITLLEIYPDRLGKEISVRTGKYENAIKNVLLYHLNRLDGTFETSVGKCFVNMFAISQNYKKKSISEYIEMLGIEDNKVGEITNVFNEYHNIADKRLKEIFENALKYLEKKKYIRTRKQLIIVKNNKYIPIDDVKRIELSVIEAEEMIDEAKEHSIKELRKKYPYLGLMNMTNVMEHYKYNEFKLIYDEYIRDNYGWDYTFEQIMIYGNEEVEDKQIDYSDYVKSKETLNKLLIDAVRNTMVTKYENLLQKYLDEDNRIESMILNTDDIAELIRVGVLDKDGVIKNRQFRYPESFIKYIDIFIDNELKI